MKSNAAYRYVSNILNSKGDMYRNMNRRILFT